MTSFADIWVAVWDVIVTETKKVSELTSSTYYGEKKTPDKAPSAYVIPKNVNIVPATNIDNYYIMHFEVGVLDRNSDLKAGLISAMQIAAKIVKEITDDRSLGGNVDKTEVVLVPNWKKVEYQNAWAGVLVTCTYMGHES